MLDGSHRKGSNSMGSRSACHEIQRDLAIDLQTVDPVCRKQFERSAGRRCERRVADDVNITGEGRRPETRREQARDGGERLTRLSFNLSHG